MRSYLDGRVLVGWANTATAEPLVRALVTELIGRDPGPLHHGCPYCGSVAHGRPYVEAPVDVSVAHASGHTVVAVSTAGPIGVDLEREADEVWVRREAVGKALGVGIVSDHHEEPVWRADVPVPGYVAAVALVTREAARAAASRTATRRTAR